MKRLLLAIDNNELPIVFILTVSVYSMFNCGHSIGRFRGLIKIYPFIRRLNVFLRKFCKLYRVDSLAL